MRISLVLPLLFLGMAGHASMAMAQSPGTFTATGNLTRPRQSHSATLLTNGKVLIAGGYDYPSPFPAWASAELYDPSTGTFTVTGDMTKSRFGHTATLLPNGQVLIAGGSSLVNSGSALASAELYDPFTGIFTATTDMTTARQGHTATLLNNGKVLIAGGYYPQVNGPCCNLASAELYDPSTGTFTVTGELAAARQGHTATLLSNGKVLIEGGYSNVTDITANPELYDPATGAFSLTGRSAYPDLYAASASLLTNGKVVSTLEESCDFDDQAEVYDPATGTFTATGNMTTYRGYSTATLLPDGKVLIAGRDDSAYPSPGTAELYDFVTGTFGAAGHTQSAEGHAATLLPDGTVLLSGGWVCCGYSIAGAEIYHPAVLVPSPVLFSLAGGVQGAILHAGTNQVVSPSNPAVAGEALEIYGVGLIDGSMIPPQVAIGGRMAEVLFFGKAPGFVGLNQVNVRVPSGIAAGPSVPVRLTYISRPSNEVTISVQ